MSRDSWRVRHSGVVWWAKAQDTLGPLHERVKLPKESADDPDRVMRGMLCGSEDENQHVWANCPRRVEKPHVRTHHRRANKVTEDKSAAAMDDFGDTIFKTSLSDQDDKELADQLLAG